MWRSLDAVLDVMRVPATGDATAAVRAVPALGDAQGGAREEACEVLVVGGGTGGVAAALAAARGSKARRVTQQVPGLKSARRPAAPACGR